MSIEDGILEYLSKPRLKYKGAAVGAFGLPLFLFVPYQKRSIQNKLISLKKNHYVTFSGSTVKITKKGKKYYAKRQARFRVFDSSFSENAPKNLLLMFDIPEARKAEREWLRRQLKAFSYTMIQKSVWVGPSPLPEGFKIYLKRIKLEEHMKMFKLARAYDNRDNGL
jgi:DNA-binding transcriptional regulator PaaX